MKIHGVMSQKFASDVLWNISSFCFLAVGGLLTNYSITNLSGDASLGIFNQAFALFIVFSQIGVGGFQFSVLHHISHSIHNEEKCIAIFTSAFVLVGGLASSLVLIIFLSRDHLSIFIKSPNVLSAFLLTLPGLIFYSLNKVIMLSLNALRHMRAYAIFQGLRALFILSSTLFLCLNKFDPVSYSLSLSLSEFLLFILLVGYSQKNAIAFSFNRLFLPSLKKHLSFGLRGVFSGILIEFNTRVDILLLGFITQNNALIGVYSFPALLAEGLGQIPIVIRQNIDPILGQAFSKQKEAESFKSVQQGVYTFFLPLFVTGCIAILIAYPFFFNLFMNNKGNTYASSMTFCILVIGVIMGAAFRPFMGIFLQGGRPGLYTSLILTVFISNIVLNILLIPYFSIYGSALATTLACLIEGALLVFLSQRIFNIRIIPSFQ
ncbi:MAG: polysaccharide biosynthesis C-terminal domain-containing protein [Elusimicrobia bacterium]|nr:polysaccharide biosynthesis C-terminal domain-containing protein [Elusimicrobiota bacterium]